MDSIENDTSNNPSIVECIRCRMNMLAEPLPSNGIVDANADT
jgi:hypothetical protein